MCSKVKSLNPLVVAFIAKSVILSFFFWSGGVSSDYLIAPHAKGAQAAKIFPGAEGFGTESSGGRGGEVCFVTNLNDIGKGSLRSCVDQEGPRIVIFKVGGTIAVSKPIKISEPYISIYGQTAPGSGILVRATLDSRSSPMVIETHDVLVQHLRLRAGSSIQSTCCRDALRIGNEDPGNVYNVVLDHNSLSWGTDQIANTWFDSNNLTLSYNIISESLHDNGSNDEGPAGRGLLIGSEGAHSISIHHNLIAHSYQRNPMLKTSGTVDVVNNVIHHWVGRGAEQKSTYEGQKVNWVGNLYLARVGGWFKKVSQPSKIGWGDILLTEENFSMKESAYFQNNIGFNKKYPWSSEWAIANTKYNTEYDPDLGYHSDVRFEAPVITEHQTDDLVEVMDSTVGATRPKRDSVDDRVLQQLIERNGIMPNCVDSDDRGSERRCENNVGGWPIMESGIAKDDSDNDGIPDAWELKVGLDPSQNDALLDNNDDGYLNIEDWIHRLGDSAQGN